LTRRNYRPSDGIESGVTSWHIESPSARAEVAQALRSSRKVPARRVRILTDILKLLAGKKEELVFLDRTVEIPAEVIEPELLSYGGEESAGVKLVIAEKLKGAAVIFIAAAASDDVDSRARIAPVFRGEVRRLDFDLLNKVNSDIVDLAVTTARSTMSEVT